VNYKHPGLPAWLLALAYDLGGTHLWVSLLLAQLCIATAYVFVFLLGRDLMGAAPALLGALVLPAVSHFTVDGLRYNHNVVQLPLWIGFCFGLWRASRSDRLPWWLFTAAMAALGFYAKFTMGLVVAFGALWIVLDAEARARLRGRTPCIALLVFVVLLIPIAVALGATDFASLAWVSRESARRGIPGSHFLRDVGTTVLIMAAALAAGLTVNRLPPRHLPEFQVAVDRRALSFLLLMGGGPMLATLAMALVAPMRLEWAAPMYSMIGLLLVALLLRRRPRLARWARAGLRHGVLALVASLALLAGHAGAALEARAAGHARKSLWPAAEIAARFDRIWQAETGRPLRIVAGDSWTAGVVGLMSDGRPSLFTDLDAQRSPAMTERRLEADGMLLVWTDGSSWRPDPALAARFLHGREAFAVGPQAAAVTVDYLLIAPGQWSDADWDRWVEDNGTAESVSRLSASDVKRLQRTGGRAQ
jgi:4-amino-4-deoxy-L-arabinose transferase-like glycosyltransferase